MGPGGGPPQDAGRGLRRTSGEAGELSGLAGAASVSGANAPMTPAEEAAIRANMIAVFTWVVLPVCLVASLVQLGLLSRPGAFGNVRQLVAAIVRSPLVMGTLMMALR